MPHRIRAPRWSKVDMVDTPADQHAKISIWKRHTPDDNPSAVNKNQEGTMPEELTEEVRKGLPDEVVSFIDSLQEQLAAASERADDADATSPDDTAEEAAADDVAKSDLPEAVRKRMDDLEARANAAEQIAKAERDARRDREWADKLAKFDGAGLPDDITKTFRQLEDANPALAGEVLKAMDKMRSQIDESALLGELGHGDAGSNSVTAEIDKRVAEIAKADGIDTVDAEAKLFSTPEGAKLYERYKAEEVS